MNTTSTNDDSIYHGSDIQYHFQKQGEIRNFLQKLCRFRNYQATHGLTNNTQCYLLATREINKWLNFYNKPNHQGEINAVIILWKHIVKLTPTTASAHQNVRRNILLLKQYAANNHTCHAAVVPSDAQPQLIAA